MKAEININTQELVKEITSLVIKELKSFLDAQRSDTPLLCVDSLAKYLGVSKQWVYERVHLKEIPYIKVGKFPRFKRSDIDKWLEGNKIPAIDPLSKALGRRDE
jgi:excisionase family DNA binding protein